MSGLEVPGSHMVLGVEAVIVNELPKTGNCGALNSLQQQFCIFIVGVKNN